MTNGFGLAVRGAVAASVLGLVACGSDGGAPGGSSQVSVDAVGGIWTGEQDRSVQTNDVPPQTVTVTSPVVLYLYEGRLLTRYVDTPSLVLSAEYTRVDAVTPAKLRAQGTFTLYDADKPLRRGELITDVRPAYDASTGFSPGSTLDGFVAEFSTTYRNGSALALVEAEWEADDSSVVLLVDAQGEVEGIYGDCEVAAGAISVLDAAVNLYDIELTLAGCDVTTVDGVYTGFASVTDNEAAGRLLHGALVGETRGVSFEVWAPPVEDEDDCDEGDDECEDEGDDN